ncbi:MAG TPA: DJ-1/PfpI family protein [Candidatus Cybelea sp.]|jgi:putative intracellular protease/amidase/YHS domain-containing protein|nr:DJ-1/PfpI family protein [Candidatus Cybelea sp.]
MKRADLLRQTATLGFVAAALPSTARAAPARSDAPIAPLVPAADGVNVAFLLSDGAVMIDFAGPWEVFHDVDVVGRPKPAFNLYTVAETTAPIRFSGGARFVPEYALAGAPAPNVVVVPAQAAPTTAVKRWLVAAAHSADLIMSVCTGAVVLAEAGLLDGRTATTHHSAFGTLPLAYPKVTVVRGVRFVDGGRIATSAGLSAGIDLALHVVARYYGKAQARQTAYDMEYQSDHWLDGENAAYHKPPAPQPGYAICAVCWMEIDPKNSPLLSYRGKSYRFCMPAHEQIFASAPAAFIVA